MYKIQYRFNPYAAWNDCIWGSRLLTFEDKKAATKRAKEYMDVAKLINSHYEYKVVEV